jgi:heme-degrading monooxygenase HmoA
MPFVSVTRLRVRSWRYLVGFTVQALRSAFQARSADGSYVVLLLRESDKTFWTCTIWQDEKAMRAFMIAGAHRHVMPKLLEWCDEASVAHWVQADLAVPPWSEIHQRMQIEGRSSKVNHPSEAHRAYRLRPPFVRKTGQLRFK